MIINEYNIFKKWFGKKDQSNIDTNKVKQLPKCWLQYDSSKIESATIDTVKPYLYFSTYGVSSKSEAVDREPKNMWFHRNLETGMIFLYREGSSLYKSYGRSLPMKYTLLNYDVSELEDYYIKSGVTKGVSVRFNGMIGKVVDILPGLFGMFDDEFERYPLSISLVFSIYGGDGRQYYRTPDMVEILDKQFDPELVSYIEEEVEDYLDQIITSEKFEINTTKVEVDRVGFIGLILKIKFKNGIKSNLEDVTTFFKNFNSLKKRLHLINKCDIDIEEITKDTVMLKITKEPPVTENIKKWIDFRDKLICSNCGEEIEGRAAKSLNSDDLICMRCKEEEFQTVKSWDFKSTDPSFIPQTTPNQILKYL